MTPQSPPLSLETRLNLLSRIAPLGDDFFRHAETMKAAGLTSFQPIIELDESFCESEEERELSRRVTIEVAKERIGNFAPYPYLRDEAGPGYRSALLQRLRAQRAERGNSFEAHDRGKPWLIQLDPCRYRMFEMMFTRNDELTARQLPYNEANARLRQQEIARFATALSLGVADSGGTRRKICGAVLAEVLGTLGFRSTSKSAARSGSLVEKALPGGWCLVWSVDFTNLRRPTGGRQQDQLGYLDLDLDLAPCSTKAAPVEQTIGHAPLRIGYNYAAPIDRTEWNYGTFRSLPELETLLRAHATVYAMLHERIEEALVSGLQATLGSAH